MPNSNWLLKKDTDSSGRSQRSIPHILSGIFPGLRQIMNENNNNDIINNSSPAISKLVSSSNTQQIIEKSNKNDGDDDDDNAYNQQDLSEKLSTTITIVNNDKDN